jgi:type IV pilus assembly protein PilP
MEHLKLQIASPATVSGETPRFRGFSRIASAALLAFFLGACGGADAPKPAANLRPVRKAQPKPAVDAGAARAAKEAYRYNASNKPDPFKPYLFAGKKQELTSPLQKYDLGQITLKAVIWGVADARAMVEDPTGKGYVVGVGSDIGKNSGKVLKIEDRKVLVRETYVDYTGHETTKDVALKIVTPNPEGEES